MGPCLGPLDIQALLLGGGSESDLAKARAHIDACPACRELVERLLSSSHGTTSAGTSPPWAEALELGPYRVLRELGRGGQATVYLAEDTRLGRKVALKVLSARFDKESAVLERFRREALALSRLDHPGICAVYEAGEIDGVSFIAMRHVEGESLSRLIAARSGGEPLTLAEIDRLSRWIEKAARALHCAHEAGVVHRDIKPGNILVTAAGDPILVDFGLARAAAAGQETLTQPGDVLGTPAYMSPEQLAGRGQEVDRRTDVYSLGVTLFQCVSGRLPFEAASREGLYRQILAGEVPDARRFCPRLPADLKTVIETAIERDPTRRYGTALELAEDLRRVREYEPIRARPAGPALRLRRWSQRHPSIATALVGSFLLLGAGLTVALVLLGRISTEQAKKEVALQAAEAGLRRAEGLRLAAQSAAAMPADPALALLLALEAHRLEPGLLATSAAYEALDALRERRLLGGHTDGVSSVAWSRDGKRLLTSSYDGTAVMWETGSGTRLQVLKGHEGVVIGAAFSPDDQRVLTASWDGTARLWEAGSGKASLVLRGHGESVNAAAWSPDGRRVLTAAGDGNAALWDAGTGQRLHLLAGHPEPVFGAEFAPDGGRALTTSARSLRVWEVESGRLVFERQAAELFPVSGRFSPDGGRLLLAASGQAAVLRAEDGLVSFTLEGHRGPVLRAIFTVSASRIATSADDGTVRLWDGESGAQLQVLSLDDQGVSILALSPDGSRVLVQAQGPAPRIYSTRTRRFVGELRGHRDAIVGAAFSPDGASIATASLDGTARIWSVESGAIPTEPAPGGPQPLCSSPDGALSLLTTDELGAQVLDSRGQVTARLEGHTQRVAAAVFDAAGAHIATVSPDATLRIWEARTGRELHRAACGSDFALDIAFNPDRSELVTGHGSGRVTFWEAATGKRLRQVAVHGSAVSHVSLDPGAGLILTGSADATARVLDAATGQTRWTLKGHRGALSTARFGPGGRLIVTAAADNTVRLWEASTGKALAVIRGHGKSYCTAELAPDGKSLRVTVDTNTVKTWPVDVFGAAASVLPRGLTPAELDHYEIGAPEERAAREAAEVIGRWLR